MNTLRLCNDVRFITKISVNAQKDDWGRRLLNVMTIFVFDPSPCFKLILYLTLCHLVDTVEPSLVINGLSGGRVHAVC